MASVRSLTGIINAITDPSTGTGVSACPGWVVHDTVADKYYDCTGTGANDWEEWGTGGGGGGPGAATSPIILAGDPRASSSAYNMGVFGTFGGNTFYKYGAGNTDWYQQNDLVNTTLAGTLYDWVVSSFTGYGPIIHAEITAWCDGSEELLLRPNGDAATTAYTGWRKDSGSPLVEVSLPDYGVGSASMVVSPNRTVIRTRIDMRFAPRLCVTEWASTYLYGTGEQVNRVGYYTGVWSSAATLTSWESLAPAYSLLQIGSSIRICERDI